MLSSSRFGLHQKHRLLSPRTSLRNVFPPSSTSLITAASRRRTLVTSTTGRSLPLNILFYKRDGASLSKLKCFAFLAIALLPGVIFVSVKIVAQPQYKNDDIIYLRILIDMQHDHSHYYTLTDLRSVEQTVALYKTYCKGAMPTIGPDALAQVLVAFDAISEDVKAHSIMKKACEDVHIALQATKEKTTKPVDVGRKVQEIMIKSATELLLMVKARQPQASKDSN